MSHTSSEFKLKEIQDQSIALMDAAGFTIEKNISVEINESLTFMGYTTEYLGKPHIVVSGNAMKSGMALNLMIHELGHVYLMQQNHPSHNAHLLTSITGWVLHNKLVAQYQETIVQGIINHIQDIYTDDISFTLFKKSAMPKDLSAFFLSWIKDPSIAEEPVQRSWENAGIVLSAAFAQANLERHKIKDTDKTVEKAIDALIKQLPKEYKSHFEFFKKFLQLLPKQISDKDFEKLLITYINTFSKMLS